MNAPPWLAELQARFGAAIRTPLARESGTLTATPSAYDAALHTEAGARLAVYNRQYWFRLLDVMQDAFPLTSRLLGAWQFNEHAARYLAETPPRERDLELATAGFVAHFAPDDARLGEAAQLDDAFARVFRAPTVAPFRPSAADAARLLDAPLLPSPAAALVHESAPLLELRTRILREPSLQRVALPAPLPAPRSWMLVRDDTGTLHIPLEPREAELHELLRELPLAAALGRLEASCTEAERAQLPARTQAWLARGIQHGFWSGLGSR